MPASGPKTLAGKAISRLNSTRHGIFSRLRVLPNVEQQVDWEVHLSSIIIDLKPLGYLERNLAERVALLLWRLGRVARHERESAALRQEQVAEDVTEVRSFRNSFSTSKSQLKHLAIPHPDDVVATAKWAQEAFALIKGFFDLPDEAKLTSDQAATLIYSIESTAEVDIHCEDFPSFPGVPDDVMLENFKAWTAGLVRGAWKVIAETAGESLDVLYTKAINNARTEFLVADFERKRVMRELDHCRRGRLLPASEDLDKISRYEAHLERCLYRALHELQRLQAVRSGTIPPIAIDVNVTSATAEVQNELD